VDSGVVEPRGPLEELPRLLTRFFDDVQELVAAQLALFKTEVREAVRRISRSALLTLAGGTLAAVGFVFCSLAAVFWVDFYIGNRALSLLAVGGAYLILGSLVALGSARKLVGPPVLERTIRELERDRQWINAKSHST